jgi:hypothetical protein
MNEAFQNCVKYETGAALASLIIAGIGLCICAAGGYAAWRIIERDKYGDNPLGLVLAVFSGVAAIVAVVVILANSYNLTMVKMAPEWVCRSADEGTKITHEVIRR